MAGGVRREVSPMLGFLPENSEAKRVPAYDEDFVLWAEGQARIIREKTEGLVGLDAANLAEEVEDMGKRDRRAAESHVENILFHLLKVDHTRDEEPVPHWEAEIRAFRGELARLLRDSPSLQGYLQGRWAVLYAGARARAAAELKAFQGTSPVLPETCPYPWEAVLGQDT